MVRFKIMDIPNPSPKSKKDTFVKIFGGILSFALGSPSKLDFLIPPAETFHVIKGILNK